MEAVTIRAIYLEVGDILALGHPTRGAVKGGKVTGVQIVPGPDGFDSVEVWADPSEEYGDMPTVTYAEDHPVTVWREVGR